MAEQRVPRFLTKPSLGTLWVHLALATVFCHRWDSGGSWQEGDPREQGFLVFKFLLFLLLLKPSQPKWATGCEASCECHMPPKQRARIWIFPGCPLGSRQGSPPPHA